LIEYTTPTELRGGEDVLFPPVASLRFATGGYAQTILNRIETEYIAINLDGGCPGTSAIICKYDYFL